MFLINSRLGLFTAARRSGRPFSRSYGAILPSSLAMNHSSALVYSTLLPVSVYGTDRIIRTLEVFLGSTLGRIIHSSEDLWYCRVSARCADLPTLRIPTHFNVLFRQYAALTLLRHLIENDASTGMLTRSPSASPFGYTLGSD